MDVEHGHAHRKAVDRSFHGFARLAIAQAHIGGSSTHVEAEDELESGEARCFESSNNTAGRSRENGANGMPARFLGRHKAAVRLHDRDLAPRGALEFS